MSAGISSSSFVFRGQVCSWYDRLAPVLLINDFQVRSMYRSFPLVLLQVVAGWIWGRYVTAGNLFYSP